MASTCKHTKMGPALQLVLATLVGSAILFSGPMVSAQGTATKSLEDELTDISGMLMKKLMPVASELATSPELSPECAGSLFKVLKATRTREPWVLRMILANGLIPNNILEGSLISLGGYEQCLKTRVYGSEGEVQAKGQYCSMFVYPPWSLMENLVHKFQDVGEFKGRLNPLTITTNEKIGKKALRIGLCSLNACSEKEMGFLANGGKKNTTALPGVFSFIYKLSISIFTNISILSCFSELYQLGNFMLALTRLSFQPVRRQRNRHRLQNRRSQGAVSTSEGVHHLLGCSWTTGGRRNPH